MDGDDKKKIKLSVRNLVEFVMRSGDLDNRRSGGANQEAMQAGGRIHRKIQRRMGSSYQAEVSMKHVVDEEEYQIVLEGRADGVIKEAAAVTIDEIKGIYMDLHFLDNPIPVHLAQAMCYGYIYSFDNQLPSIGIQMTYCNIETEEIKRFHLVKSFEELSVWFDGLIHEYVKWARYLYQHGILRDDSIKDLEFPYPYRPGQKELAVSVYKTIRRRKNLFIQAPTGIGKTLSTVYPALKAVGEGHGEKIFYLTARTITRSVAEETFEILRSKGLYFNTVTITAKDKLCFLPKTECNPDACPYAKGHFDRVNDAVYEILHREAGIDRNLVIQYAREFKVCPFEFCLDISNWTDGIICDYNYVFDPSVRLKRYFSEGVSGEYLFLVDEAHNLVSRAREMFSAQIVKEDVLLAKRILKEKSARLFRLLERINHALLELKRECDGCQVLPDANHLASLLMSMFGELERFMEENQEFEDRELILDFYFTVRHFLDIFERVDKNYRIYAELRKDGSFLFKLFCINPSRNLKECLDKGNSTIFFSATLLPVMYYKELLSGNQEDYAVYAESPFDKKNRLLIVASDVSSRYTRRNQREFEKILSYIIDVVQGKKGNYMIFFPSYQYLNAVRECFEQRGKDGCFILICQDTHMEEEDREEFLAKFDREYDTSLVAFCVMGGIFSEGIDLKEEKLIGAVIVGTGLPMVCTEQEILKSYFDEAAEKQKEQGENCWIKGGFDFAYQYPGMNKVMQAAGRVIRTVRDRGVIVLLDDRFLLPDYQQLFPREWQDFEIVNRFTVKKTVGNFWNI